MTDELSPITAAGRQLNAELARSFSQAAKQMAKSMTPFISAMGKQATVISEALKRERIRQADRMEYGRYGDLIGPMKRDIDAMAKRIGTKIDRAHDDAMRKLLKLEASYTGKTAFGQDATGRPMVAFPDGMVGTLFQWEGKTYAVDMSAAVLEVGKLDLKVAPSLDVGMTSFDIRQEMRVRTPPMLRDWPIITGVTA